MSPWLTLAIVIVILAVGTAFAAARQRHVANLEAQREYDNDPELQATLRDAAESDTVTRQRQYQPRHRAD